MNIRFEISAEVHRVEPIEAEDEIQAKERYKKELESILGPDYVVTVDYIVEEPI